jgi:hypothetical protein
LSLSSNPPVVVPTTQTLQSHSNLQGEFSAVHAIEESSTTWREEEEQKKILIMKGTQQAQNNASGGTKEKKMKFPCNICGDDHLTHQFPRMDEIHHYFSQ